MVLLESEIRAISDEVFVTTDDGSYGRKGLVIDPLNERIAAGRPPDLVLAIGPVRMMQAVAEVTLRRCARKRRRIARNVGRKRQSPSVLQKGVRCFAVNASRPGARWGQPNKQFQL